MKKIIYLLLALLSTAIHPQIAAQDCNNPIPLSFDTDYITTFSGADNLNGYNCSTRSAEDVADEVYTFTLNETSSISIEFSGGLNAFVVLLDACNPNNCIATSDSEFGSGLSVEYLPVGTYHLVLERGTRESGESDDYFMYVSAYPQPIYYVKATATGIADGTDWTNAFTHLQDAITTARTEGLANAEIWVAGGDTYKPVQTNSGNTTPTDNREKTFFLDFTIRVKGGFAGTPGTEADITTRDWRNNPSILSGDLNGDDVPDLSGSDLTQHSSRQDNAYQVIETQKTANNRLFVDGFHITGGNAYDVNFPDDFHRSSNNGGGWLNTVPENLSSPSIVNVHNCVFSKNSARNLGAAIYSKSFNSSQTAAFNLHNSKITNSYANSGAIYNGADIGRGFLTIYNSILVNNESGQGVAGILSAGAVNSSKVSMYNVTMNANHAQSLISAYHNAHSTPTEIYNSIIWGNNTSGFDGPSEITNSSTITLNHCIVVNQLSNVNKINVIHENPLYVESGVDVHIQSCSPAIDAGNNSINALQTDLDGLPRKYNDGIIDMGAYEFQGDPTDDEIICYFDFDGDGYGGNFQSTFCTTCPEGTYPEPTDCNDNPNNGGAAVHPGATEICGDCIDNNCDGMSLASCAPVIIYVKEDATGNGDGTSWTDAYPTLHEGLAEASTCGDSVQIWLANGVYKPTLNAFGFVPNNPRLATFFINFDVEIYGGFAGFAGTEGDFSNRDWESFGTVLSGNIGNLNSTQDNIYHVIASNQNEEVPTILMDGIGITGGSATAGEGEATALKYGGAWNNLGAVLQINNCLFSNNTADLRGGAIYSAGGFLGSLTLHNTWFSDNSGFDSKGGAIFSESTHLFASDCIFEYNTSQEGGAIHFSTFMVDAEMDLTNCKFLFNLSTNSGGAISYSSQETASDKFTATNCTFVANNAFSEGQAIFLETPSRSGLSTVMELTNCTLTANHDFVTNGAAIYFENNFGGGLIQNCILWENAIEIVANTGFSELVVNNSIVQGGWATGSNISTDNPEFIAQPSFNFEGDIRLAATSPAIDIGDNTVNTTTTDIRGYDRIQGQQIDLGAHEYCANEVVCYRDEDGDTYGDDGFFEDFCETCPQGWVSNNTDCNDDDANIHPNANDICGDCIDNNCNGNIDESCLTIAYVNANATGLNNGTSWNDAFTDLQSALDMLDPEDCPTPSQIWVAEGIYHPSEVRPIEGTGTGTSHDLTFFIKHDVEIYGGFDGTETMLSQRDWAAHPTILSGEINNFNVFNVVITENLSDAFLMNGFTITGGRAYDTSDRPTHPHTKYGGAWHHTGGNLRIQNCQFTDNASSLGGGALYIATSFATLSLNNCQFSDNISPDIGGAILNQDTKMAVSNCLFDNNSTEDEGGSVLIFYNLSMPDAAVFSNCIFQNNSVLSVGSAISLRGAVSNVNTLNINHCNFVNNFTFPNGNIVFSIHPMTISNSIFWDNSSNSVTPNSNNITINHSIIPEGWPMGTGIITDDPLFLNDDTTPFDLHLATCSPAINAGDNNLTSTTTDFEGNPRIFDNTVDMGAYEVQENQTVLLTCYLDEDEDGYGQTNISSSFCITCPTGWAIEEGDCDDTNADVNPGAIENCHDNIDNNCNDETNEDCYDNPDEPFVMHVNNSSDNFITGEEDGSSWEDAYGTLQDAINFAKVYYNENNQFFQIWVATGNYHPELASDGTVPPDARDKTFYFDVDVQLYGGFQGMETNIEERNCIVNPTILSGDVMNTPNDFTDDVYTVVMTQNVSSDFVMDGFIIEKGNANVVTPYTPIGWGGGWFNSTASSPSIVNCTFRNNKAEFAAGFFNLADDGESNPTFTNCAFIANEANQNGGALGNISQGVGGISNLLFYNCMFTKNKTGNKGAVMFTSAAGGTAVANPTIVNCSFSANGNNTNNGTLVHGDEDSYYIYNSILWGNDNNEIIGFNSGNTTNTQVHHSIIQGGWSGAGSNNLSVNPLFQDALNENLRLLESSEARDTGDNNAPGLDNISFDLDCNSRIENGTVDMGAYELSAPLAVEWLDFSAKAHPNHIQLYWQTTHESNNKGFEVQRSPDGIHWSAMAWVDATHPTNTIADYTFLDKTPLTPLNYYRLKQVDTNGTWDWSSIVGVTWKKANMADLQLFPNPAHQSIHLLVSDSDHSSIEFEIYNALGQLVRRGQLQDANLDIQGLAEGTYWLKVTIGDQTLKKAFVKM